MKEKIRLGISTCLLGEKVRYDGGHRLDRFLTETLGPYVDYVPVCPEVECGLPVPREPMRLEGDVDSPRLVTTHSKRDVTDRMVRWAKRRVIELEKDDLCGFIFKSNSPSSGMERVRIYDARGTPSKKGVGIFAARFMEHFPSLPVEDEGRLHDPAMRENFIGRIFTLKRWREVLAMKMSLGSLVDFHAKHKLLLLSHSPGHSRIMGRLVAAAQGIPLKDLHQKYQTLLMEALRVKTTPTRNANVLQHMMGYFKALLSSDEKKELVETIELYRKEDVPLIVPMTLIKHYVRKYDEPYLKEQVYLNPHAIELQLRNHA